MIEHILKNQIINANNNANKTNAIIYDSASVQLHTGQPSLENP